MGPRTIIKGLLIAVALFLYGITSLIWVQAQEPPTYQNEAMGIKLACPPGWFMAPGEKVKEMVNKNIGDITSVESIKEAYKKLGILVVFSKYPYGSPREFNSNIALTSEEINPEYTEVFKTPLDVANANLVSIKVMFKDAKVIEEPSMVTVAGREGAHFIYEGTSVMGYLELRLKCSAYVFTKDNLVYTLSFTDKVEDFDADLEAFQSAVNTITFQ